MVPMRRWHWLIWLLVLGLAVLILTRRPTEWSPQGLMAAQVVRVIDGDTLEVLLGDGAKEKVRYIGVDTPEAKHPRVGVECFGRQASAFNESLVLGRTVWLELDVQRRDKYRRLLAYVWLDGDRQKGRMANALLVAEGYAQVSTYPPNVKYVELFQRLQGEAIENNKGLWGNCPGARGR